MLWPTDRGAGPRISAYPPRERWVRDVTACIKLIETVSGLDRLQHHEPTPHEVGIQRQARFIVGYNITNPLLTKWVYSVKRASL